MLWIANLSLRIGISVASKSISKWLFAYSVYADNFLSAYTLYADNILSAYSVQFFGNIRIKIQNVTSEIKITYLKLDCIKFATFFLYLHIMNKIMLTLSYF